MAVKRKTLKVKRSMLKRGGKKLGKKTSKKTLKKTSKKKGSKKGGAVRMPARYFGSSHETGYTANGDQSTAMPQPANTFWNGFGPKEPCN